MPVCVAPQYYRITSEVNPNTVRPMTVLKTALSRLQRLRVDEDDAGVDYEYLCDQLKGIRQVGAGRVPIDVMFVSGTQAGCCVSRM
jgi:hypothetical protein